MNWGSLDYGGQEMIRIFVKFALIFNLVPRIWTHNSTENSSIREHKVHNIVLYPDKHSWCKATPIVQVVTHPGCNAIKTDNNVCVGACFSYIVPRTVPETPGDVLPYCDSCKPGHVTWKKVILECNDGAYKNQNFTKYVEYIHDCNCGSCNDLSSERLPREDVEMEDSSVENGLINDYSLLHSTGEVNQILPNASHSEFKTAISRMLLKTLNNEDESVLENAESKGLHRNVWKNLLERVESSNDSLDASKFNEIVKSVENELKVKFNYKRLKQVLLKLKKYDNNTKLSNLFNKPMDPTVNSTSRTTDLLTPNHSKVTLIQEEAPSQGISRTNSHLPNLTTSAVKINNEANTEKSATYITTV